MKKIYESGFNREYLKKKNSEFIRDFDIQFNRLMMSDIQLGITLEIEDMMDEKYSIEFVFSSEYKVRVLDNAYDYLTKYMSTLLRLQKRVSRLEINFFNKKKSSDFIGRFMDTQLKLLYLDRKRSELGQSIKISETLLNTNKKLKKDNLLINGKKPNISERYKIANEILGLYEVVNKKNISSTEKHICIAHIMGCNQQTARELFNGTQVKRTPIREDVINLYLKKFK